MVKWTKKYVHPTPNFKYGSFSTLTQEIYSKFFKSIIMEASMFSLNFDELNTKFEKL
jgi:hypothetical protein